MTFSGYNSPVVFVQFSDLVLVETTGP